MIKYRFIAIALAAAAAALFVFQPDAASEEELDPLKVAGDTHKLVFENKFVRVIQAQVPAGQLEPKHRHPHGLTVYLKDYTIEQKTFPDGKVTRGERKFGTVAWSEPIVHEVKNVSQVTSHAIRIELK
jgi:hypothetical protein